MNEHINIDTKSEIQLDDNEFIKNTLPYVRKIYGNIIINARKINTYNNCGPVDNKIIDRYDRIYKNLFEFYNKKNCEICKESLFNGRIMTSSCGHCFHEDCLLKINNTNDIVCPLCRQQNIFFTLYL